VSTLFISFMKSASPERDKGQYHFESKAEFFTFCFN